MRPHPNSPVNQASTLDRFRPWFYAAAAYNLIWGTVVVLAPNLFFQVVGMAPLNYPPIMQGMGMIVGVYALGYWLIARNPVRFGPFVYIGLLGKLFGPIGFVGSALRHELPWSFGWMNLTNDVIWLPAFICFAVALVKIENSAAALK